MIDELLEFKEGGKMATYITFRKNQHHIIGNNIIDKNCIVVVPSLSPEEGQKKAQKLFGRNFHTEYYHSEWITEIEEKGTLQFSRGYIYID